MKQVLIVRSHEITENVGHLLEKAQHLNFPVFLAVDETKTDISSPYASKVSLNIEKIESLRLPAVPDCFWMLGDYVFYVCRNELPPFDYYWMIEQDVHVNFDNMQRFFDLFANNKEDFLAPELEKIDPSWWSWTQTMEPFVGQTWRCFFPVTRISGRAIDYLYHRRKSTFSYISNRLAKSGHILRVPNDEAFVASELCEAGFSCSDLKNHCDYLYNRSTFRFRKPFPFKLFAEIDYDDRVYHPVIDSEHFLDRLGRRFHFLAERNDIAKMKSESDYGEFGKLRNFVDSHYDGGVQLLEKNCPQLADIWS